MLARQPPCACLPAAADALAAAVSHPPLRAGHCWLQSMMARAWLSWQTPCTTLPRPPPAGRRWPMGCASWKAWSAARRRRSSPRMRGCSQPRSRSRSRSSSSSSSSQPAITAASELRRQSSSRREPAPRLPPTSLLCSLAAAQQRHLGMSGRRRGTAPGSRPSPGSRPAPGLAAAAAVPAGGAPPKLRRLLPMRLQQGKWWRAAQLRRPHFWRCWASSSRYSLLRPWPSCLRSRAAAWQPPSTRSVRARVGCMASCACERAPK